MSTKSNANQQKQQNNNESGWRIDNEEHFKYLKQIQHLNQAKNESLKEKDFPNYLKNSTKLMKRWFGLMNSDYILVEYDENTKKIKLYEYHSRIKNELQLSQFKLVNNLKLNEIFKWNDQIQIKFTKNYINKAILSHFKYNIFNYHNEYLQNQSPINFFTTFGVNLDHQKMLGRNLYANKKKIFINYQTATKNLPFNIQEVKASIFIANRQNFIKKKANEILVGQNIVKKNSDLIGYKFITHHHSIGLKLKFEGGFDYFNRSYFQKVHFNFGNFKQYENKVVEYVLNGGMIVGKNLFQNDLLDRYKNRWVQDKSTSYLQARINLIVKNIHPIISGFLQIVPMFYLQGTVSNNLKQVKTKYEMDYGIGLRFLNFNASLDTSLLRIGKNIDDINSSFRIIF